MDETYPVLPENIETFAELEEWKNNHNQSTHHQREVARNMSIAKYGIDNLTRYEIKKTELLSSRDPSILVDGEAPSADTKSAEPLVYDESSSEIEQRDHLDDGYAERINRARQAEADGLVIMVNTDKDQTDYDDIYWLSKKWEKLQSLSQEKRDLSNQTAMMIFGKDNYNLYAGILNTFLDLQSGDSMFPDRRFPTEDDSCEPQEENIHPYYSPNEMINVKTSSPLVSESGEILDEYRYCRELTDLTTLLLNEHNKSKREALKEQILSYWWNPEIPFTREAATRTWARHQDNNDFKVIDYMDMYMLEAERDEEDFKEIPSKLTAEYLKDKIVPVFIALISGNSIVSKSIKAYTKSEWSHASIGFDSTLQRLYSFGIYNNDVRTRSGFTVESLNKYKKDYPDMKIKVFALFVTPEQKACMEDTVRWYLDHQNDTKYPIKTLFDIALKKKPRGRKNDEMICSQFVYTILLLANFKLKEDKAENLVTPAELDELANDPRFYAVYHGKIKDYKYKVVDKLCLDILPSLPMEMYGIEEATGTELVRAKSSIGKRNLEHVFEIASKLY